MANTKISAMPAASALGATDLFAGVQGGANVKITALQAQTFTLGKYTLTQPATAATLTIADGKTLTASNTLILAGTDAQTMTFPSTSATIARTDAAQTFTGIQTFSTPIAVGSGGSGVANTGNLTWNAAQTFSFTSAQTMTFPSTSATIARTDAGQTFTGTQTFGTPIAVGSGGSGVANTGNLTWNAAQTLSFTSGQTMTFPGATTTLAGLGTAQSFTALQSLTAGATITGPLKEVVTVVAAAGATQGNATAIAAGVLIVNVTVTTSTEGVKLPTAATGRIVTLLTPTTKGYKVYGGAAGQLINANTTATTAYAVTTNKPVTFIAVDTTHWRAIKGG